MLHITIKITFVFAKGHLNYGNEFVWYLQTTSQYNLNPNQLQHTQKLAGSN
jgi:hypothetical protein